MDTINNDILQAEEDAFAEINDARKVKDPDDTIEFRRLQIDDYDRGYYDTISNLTVTGDPTKEDFEARFKEISSIPDTYK